MVSALLTGERVVLVYILKSYHKILLFMCNNELMQVILKNWDLHRGFYVYGKVRGYLQVNSKKITQKKKK